MTKKAMQTPAISPERYAEMSGRRKPDPDDHRPGHRQAQSQATTTPCAGVAAWAFRPWTRQCAAATLWPPSRLRLDDQIMLATSKGQSIRVPVEGISFRSRSAGGVKVFDTGKGEEVVSVAWIADQGEDEDETETETSETAE